MADFDPVTGSFVVPWWAAIALAALVVALVVLAVLRAGGGRALSALAQLGAVAVVMFLGWSGLEKFDQREHAEDRRALDTRIADLAGRAMVPGSALGCLNPVAADIDEACEKAVFASPETTASAVSFVTAQLVLLGDARDLEGRSPASVGTNITRLRRELEHDRYGIVAHVLVTRDGCSADECDAFSLLEDSGRVAANILAHAFETRLARATTAWSGHQAQAAAAAAPAAPPPAPVVSAATFPSAATIPPVSIMNNEPGATGQNGMDDQKKDAKAEAKPAAAAPKRPAEKPAPKRVQGAAPMPIAPAQADASGRVQ